MLGKSHLKCFVHEGSAAKRLMPVPCLGSVFWGLNLCDLQFLFWSMEVRRWLTAAGVL